MTTLRVLACGAAWPGRDKSWQDGVPASVRRRDPRIWQLAYAAAARALTVSPRAPVSIVTATALGALDETRSCLEGLFATGLGSPRSFIASVHNSMAGKLAIELKITGVNLTLCDGPNSLASALVCCSLLDQCDLPALVVAADERIELLERLAPHLPGCGALGSGSWEEGAAAFVVGCDEGFPSVEAYGPRVCAAAPGRAFEELLPPQAQAARRTPPSSTADSLLGVPARLADYLLSGERGPEVIGAYSMSGKSVSAVRVCA